MYVCNCINKPMQSVHSTIVYNSKRKPETIQIPIVNLLKEKDKWFSQQNRAYSGIAERVITTQDKQTMTNHRQVQRTKERNTLL